MKFVMTIFVILALQMSAFADDDLDVDTESCASANGKNIARYAGDLGSVFISETGVTRNGEFYPFGYERVVDDERTVGIRTNKLVETRIAFDLRKEKNAIVYVQAYRRLKQKGQEASSLTWAMSMFTSDFSAYPLIYKFTQNVLVFDPSQKIARAQFTFVNHYDKKDYEDYEGGIVHPDLVTPEVTINQLRDPDLLASPVFQPFMARIRNLETKFGYHYEDILALGSCQ